MNNESISALYPVYQRRLHVLQHQIERHGSSLVSEPEIEADIGVALDDLMKDIVQLDLLANQEGARRDSWRQRVKLLTEDLNRLRMTFAKQSHQAANAREDRHIRDKLMGGIASRQQRAVCKTIVQSRPLKICCVQDAEQELRTNQSLQSSHRIMDELEEMGAAAMDSLRRQRATLKSARTKLLDIGQSLGVSRSVLQYVERADLINLWLTIGLMIATLCILGLTWWYHRK